MRKILEDLIFIGAAEDTILLYGKKWKLNTLTSQQHLDATSATSGYDTLSRIYALKMEILGRSLKGIDDIILDNEGETIEFVKKLQPQIVNKLFDEYEKLQQKQNESLNDLDEIKN